MLVLPLFAIPLGLASRRRRRGMGMVVGLVVVILYHHLMRFGASLASLDPVSPWIGLWLPVLRFNPVSFWGF